MDHLQAPRSVEVAIAALVRDGRWLVALRHRDSHLGGLWEFPGGKRAAGESAAEAALRELREECDVEGRVVAELDAIVHEYPDRRVRMTPVLCVWVCGEATPRASQECRWVSHDELLRLPMPAANAALLRRLKEMT
jgi:mutator protein MutT